ncbi:HEAT repeat domain-containing protein [Nocardioides litoris]|uniref:HEAT repeat domain-containing protein n=1 Tax=Nocardioides litoris TaxID=1926648 RepID=UPI0014768B23|nr:HEAT repeat domain-containing protein [Nocardioides litoris]
MPEGRDPLGVAGAGEGAARLLRHELPRVRVQALRCLAVSGDVEHVDGVRRALDDPHPDVAARAGLVLEVLHRRLDLR